MTKKTVLAIGIEPSSADLSAFPGLTAELVRNYIDAQIEGLRTLGFDAEGCLIDLGETAEAVALLLFEKVINLVHAHAPHARICFNTTPADTAEAVQRWMRP